jgi:hypothetical protein
MLCSLIGLKNEPVRHRDALGGLMDEGFPWVPVLNGLPTPGECQNMQSAGIG